MESAGTHQGKRHYKIKRNGGLFIPPFAVTDMYTPPQKNTQKYICTNNLKEQAMSRIILRSKPCRVSLHQHTSTHTHQASLEVLGDG